jgi:hypothetical protein
MTPHIRAVRKGDADTLASALRANAALLDLLIRRGDRIAARDLRALAADLLAHAREADALEAQAAWLEAVA